MKKHYLLILAFTLYSLGYSQINFEAGSITKNGVKVDGYVKIKSDSEIEFKTSLDSEANNYNTKSVEGYTLNEPSRMFISKIIKKTQESYFFEYIVKGDISLLYANANYYLYNLANDIHILEIKKTSGSNKSGAYEGSISTYKGVLNYYAKDCPEIQKEANTTKFSRNKLADFVISLNECQNSPIQTFDERTVITLLEIGVTTGGNFANFERTGSEPYKTSGGDFGLNLGSFVSFSPDIQKYNLTFQLGVEYNQKKNDYSFTRPNFLYERNIITDAAFIEPYITILYQPFYNKNGLLSPYVGLGSSYGLKLKHEVRITDQITDEFYELDNNQNVSLIFKLGTFINIKKEKILFEVVYSDYNYQERPGFSEESGSNLQIKIGYLFNLNR